MLVPSSLSAASTTSQDLRSHLGRRQCLSALALGAGALALPRDLTRGAASDPEAFWTLVQRLEKLAADGFAEIPALEDAYTFEAAAGLLRLKSPPEAKGYQPLPMMQGAAVARLHRSEQLFVGRFRLDAQAKVPLHDHEGYSVVFLVTKGHLEVRSFDGLGAGEEEGVLPLREVARLHLKTGRAGTLSSTRENFHMIAAGSGQVEGLEIFTRAGPGAGSRFYDLTDDPGAKDDPTRFLARRR